MKNIDPEILKELERISKGIQDVVVESAKTCSICNMNKTRVYKTKTPSGFKRYVDNNGRWWKGRKCPDCIKIEHRNYMRGIRGTKKPRV